MTAVIIFCLLSVLLVIGKILRTAIPLLQRCYLPSSVIGGFTGLILFQCFPQLIPAKISATIGQIPGFMINVIFATLFLGTVTPPLRQIVRHAFPQLCFGQILAWGQYVIGFATVGLVLIPLFGVNEGFGNLLEISFQGGHGTVSGMAESFSTFGWEDGITLGYTMATAGMLLAVLLGIILVNWAARRGHIQNIRPFGKQDILQQRGIYRSDKQPAAGAQTVYCGSIDSLAWHIALVGIAILAGFGILHGLRQLELLLRPETKTLLMKGFPLFPFCMIGGLLLQNLAHRAKAHTLIDHGQMQRIAGAALDFLVVSAIVGIRVNVVLEHWQSMLILIILGTLLSLFMVMIVARRIFRESWFECAIAEFGQSLGVTATGLLLLRAADPNNNTNATQAFGYKQLLHEPIMGGGLWTALALPLLYQCGWFTMLIISGTALLIWVTIAFLIARKNKER